MGKRAKQPLAITGGIFRQIKAGGAINWATGISHYGTTTRKACGTDAGGDKASAKRPATDAERFSPSPGETPDMGVDVGNGEDKGNWR